ncbi:hypothetical protein A2U01_0042707, partial [Trifolium medium]|nr:hypothetical protein [Trifolium medium]
MSVLEWAYGPIAEEILLRTVEQGPIARSPRRLNSGQHESGTFYPTLKTLFHTHTNLSVGAPVDTQPPPIYRNGRGGASATSSLIEIRSM